jgi:hypothetical protein
MQWPLHFLSFTEETLSEDRLLSEFHMRNIQMLLKLHDEDRQQKLAQHFKKNIGHSQRRFCYCKTDGLALGQDIYAPPLWPAILSEKWSFINRWFGYIFYTVVGL